MDVGNKYYIQPERRSLTLESFTSWRSSGAPMLRRWTCPIHGDLFPWLLSVLTLLEILKSFIPNLKRWFSDYIILHNQVIILVFYYLLLNKFWFSQLFWPSRSDIHASRGRHCQFNKNQLTIYFLNHNEPNKIVWEVRLRISGVGKCINEVSGGVRDIASANK